MKRIYVGFATVVLLLSTPFISYGTDLFLNEFQASNSSTLTNEFGETEDWIEIYNNSSQSINLAGWSLTDNPTHLTKWTFPSVTLGAKQYLVVWASNRDVVQNGEIHTNFKLDGDGEYLALVRPDGTTVEHEYAPKYPVQKKDVSYGILLAGNGNEITLSDTQTDCKYLVPTSNIGTAWHGREFDDSTWSSGLTGVGYEQGSSMVTVTYQAEACNVTSGCNAQDSWGGYTGTGYVDMGGNGSYFEWNDVDGENGGTVEFSFRYASSTERPCTISVNGTDVGTITFTPTGGFSTWETQTLSIPLSSGDNIVRVTASTSAGGPNVDKMESESLVEGSGPYDEYINTRVGELMYSTMASVYIRIPFVVDDPAELREFMVSMRYEDGYAAYLNGTAISSDNLPDGATPSTLDWNSDAKSARNEGDAVTMSPVFTSFSPQDYLTEGTNVLVIHGLNTSVGSSDLLMQTEIVGTLVDEFTVSDNHYFSTPSPEEPNFGSAQGFVGDTHFSVDRGFYTHEFDLTISCDTENNEIRYTLDGSTPSDVSGTVFSDPIPISKTTVVRAIAYRKGWESSDVDTQTYIFPVDVIQQPEQPDGWPTLWSGGYKDYEMDPDIVGSTNYASEFPATLLRAPSLSIVTDQDNLFGGSGIYDNSTRSGVEWERPASAELIYPDGSNGFQINCGLRIQGGASRISSKSPKHSFRLLFKDIYGPTKLNFDLFEDSPVNSFDTIILRAGYNNSWIHSTASQRSAAQYTRDWFTRKSFTDMGHAASYGTMVHLYVNGLYWGIYNPTERPTASFTSEHLGGSKEDWDTMNSGVIKDGDFVAWDAMFNIGTNGLSNLSDYEAFRQYCDVENLADYMIINHYAGNGDWDHHNWYAGRRRRAGEGYQFFCWDSENAMGSATANTTGKHNPGKPTDLFQSARTNAEFRLLFADRLHKHFFNDGALTPTNALATWGEVSDVVDGIAVAESARWGDYRTTNTPYTVNDHYLPKQNSFIEEYFPNRTAIVLDQYRDLGLYPDLDAPEFDVHGGTFTDFATISLSGSNTMYYTTDGSDPREFGSGAVVGSVYSGPVTLEYSTRVVARCFDGAEWSASTEAEFYDLSPSTLRVSEVMYAPRLPDSGEAAVSGDASDYQFVELYNAGAETIGLVGMEFVEGIRFDFSKGELETLAAGACALVVKDRNAFLARYPGLEAVLAGEFIGGLSDGGEQIKLKRADAVNVISFTYGDGRDWPLAADGAGHSLVPLDIASGENLSYGGNWSASVNGDGSPGAAEPQPDAALCLNEITGHTDLSDPAYPDYDSNDWIELFNPGTSTVSLTGYYLSDDPYDLLKWPIPAGLNLAPGAFMAFDEISGFHSPITSGFGINKAGEQILLSYAPGGALPGVVDSHSFKGQENGASIGRVPDGAAYWVPTVPTLGTENVLAGQNIVLSEIMYHPLEEGGTNENADLEFLEVFNPTTSAVPLWTWEDTHVLGSWRIKGDVGYTFPSNTMLTAEQRVLIVPFDPQDTLLRNEFSTYYNLAESVEMFGPFDGKLSNQGGRITLEKPQAPDAFDEAISWVIVDELFYSDDEPWMSSTDGLGYGLHRALPGDAAADPESWADAVPSPGTGEMSRPDLFIQDAYVDGNVFYLEFNLFPNVGYQLESTTNLNHDVWLPYIPLMNETEAEVLPTSNAAYYRLRRD